VGNGQIFSGRSVVSTVVLVVVVIVETERSIARLAVHWDSLSQDGAQLVAQAAQARGSVGPRGRERRRAIKRRNDFQIALELRLGARRSDHHPNVRTVQHHRVGARKQVIDLDHAAN